MIFQQPRVRWSAVFLFAVTCLVWWIGGALAEEATGGETGVAEAAEVVKVEAASKAERATSPASPPAEPQATLSGLPKDLTVLSREELIGLIKDLTLQNQALFVRIARLETDLAEAQPMLQAKIETQGRTIDRLRRKLAFQEREIEAQREADALARAAQPGADADELPPGDAGDIQQGGTTIGPGAATPTGETPTAGSDAGTPADPGVWEYRFAYEYGLIKTSGSGHITIRDKDGNRERQKYDYSEYRHDALWVNLFIRNDSKQPMRFTGLMALQDDKPLFAKHRPLLATKAFRTPLLQPGEVFQVTEDEVAIDRPWKVEHIELLEVQAYAQSADPDPDPR